MSWEARGRRLLRVAQGDGGSDGSGRWIGECRRLRVAWLVGGPPLAMNSQCGGIQYTPFFFFFFFFFLSLFFLLSMPISFYDAGRKRNSHDGGRRMHACSSASRTLHHQRKSQHCPKNPPPKPNQQENSHRTDALYRRLRRPAFISSIVLPTDHESSGPGNDLGNARRRQNPFEQASLRFSREQFVL